MLFNTVKYIDRRNMHISDCGYRIFKIDCTTAKKIYN